MLSKSPGSSETLKDLCLETFWDFLGGIPTQLINFLFFFLKKDTPIEL